jgi:hypothetical protein
MKSIIKQFVNNNKILKFEIYVITQLIFNQSIEIQQFIKQLKMAKKLIPLLLIMSVNQLKIFLTEFMIKSKISMKILKYQLVINF